MITIELGTKNYLYTLNKIQQTLKNESKSEKKMPIILILKNKFVYQLQEYKQLMQKIAQSAIAIAFIVEDFFQDLIFTFLKKDIKESMIIKNFSAETDAKKWINSFM